MKIKLILIGLLIFTSVSYSQIPYEGLVAYYPFNGNANDESSNSNNGIVNGATLTDDRFGKANSAYSFDGVDDYIEVPHDTTLSTGSQRLTISFWMKVQSFPDVGNEYEIISKASGGGAFAHGYHNYIREAGEYSMIAQDVNITLGSGPFGIGPLSSQATISLSNWHHIVSVIDEDTCTTYVDGVFASSYVTSGQEIGQNTENITIGWDGGEGEGLSVHFKGMLDDIRIYDTALTESDVKALNEEAVCKTVVSVQDTLNIYLSQIITTVYDVSSAVTTVKVFPNPSQQNLTVEIDNPSNLSGVTIKVLDAQSAELHNEMVTGSTQSIDVSSWSAGVYFLHVLNGSTTVDIRKIVVNN